MGIVPADEHGVAEAVAALRAGDVIAYPTETVYGLGVDPAQPAAVAKLAALKGRTAGHAMLLVAGNRSHVAALASQITDAEAALMDAYWPGPLSLVLPPSQPVAAEFLNESGKVCVRIPADPVACKICDRFGGAISSTSANRSGEPPATRPGDALLPGVALVLDAGPREAAVPSTVYDCSLDRVYREGAVPVQEVRRLRAQAP